MKTQIASTMALLLGVSVAIGAAPQRPPSVPLITCDPYFSVWSPYDNLTEGPTVHWTNRQEPPRARRPQPLTSLITIDGHAFRVMGDAPTDLPAAHQVGLTVSATQTKYDFEEAGVHLTLTFTTPQLPDDLMVCSRPITYLTWTAKSLGNDKHDVSVYLDASALLAVNKGDQVVQNQHAKAGDLVTLRVGTFEQPVLDEHGDDQRIDWGYFYLAGKPALAMMAPATAARTAFIGNAAESPADENSKIAAKDAPVLAMSFKLGQVGSDAASTHALLAYDDLYSIRFFNTDLKAYWTRDGAKIDDLLQTAEKDYDALLKRCDDFDKELNADMQKIGGESYQQLGVLSWRQALAAQKICVDANGQPLMFAKENFSNGCIATVDVLYPAAPQMLAFSPNLLKASLEPLMQYSASPLWKWDSAPHDLGQYPHATGQVYGDIRREAPMPVEESGNLLILHAALARATGNADYSKPYWPTLTKWANFLKNKGIDPENQLTTDDFAGHIARNANLSIKAIMGMESYAMLAEMLGHNDVAAEWRGYAKEGAKRWLEMADQGDHYGLVFGDKGKGTWSQKYNLVWDKLLGFGVFPLEVVQKEEAFYLTKMNKYGLPLDSRKEYTKLDWELWTATMLNKHEDFLAIVDRCALWANETPDRAPLGDWYQTVNGHKEGFQARSVVGGLFIPFLADGDLWKKFASRDKTQAGNWAAGDFTPPQTKVILPAADTEAATWKYTTDTPAEGWQNPDFAAADWKQGRSGFGTPRTPGARVGTRWNSDDIWIRREFTLGDQDVHDAHLWMHHDDDAEVYINGLLASRQGNATGDYATFKISAEALATLKPGKNTIAIHCHQTGGGQYIDAGLVEIVKKK